MADRPYDFLKELGARLAIARREIGISQAKFAKAIGLSPRAYQSYESGERSIPVEALVALQATFQTDLEWVLSGRVGYRPQHDLAAFQKFYVDLDRYLIEKGIRLRSESRGAIVARWYKGVLDGKPVKMDQVHTWIELVSAHPG